MLTVVPVQFWGPRAMVWSASGATSKNKTAKIAACYQPTVGEILIWMILHDVVLTLLFVKMMMIMQILLAKGWTSIKRNYFAEAKDFSIKVSNRRAWKTHADHHCLRATSNHLSRAEEPRSSKLLLLPKNRRLFLKRCLRCKCLPGARSSLFLINVDSS